MLDDFTQEERRLVLSYLQPIRESREAGMWYVAYILPSALFATYAIWNRDFAAALVAYLALLMVALFSLSYGRRRTAVFRSILEKYEAKVGAGTKPYET